MNGQRFGTICFLAFEFFATIMKVLARLICFFMELLTLQMMQTLGWLYDIVVRIMNLKV